MGADDDATAPWLPATEALVRAAGRDGPARRSASAWATSWSPWRSAARSSRNPAGAARSACSTVGWAPRRPSDDAAAGRWPRLPRRGCTWNHDVVLRLPGRRVAARAGAATAPSRRRFAPSGRGACSCHPEAGPRRARALGRRRGPRRPPGRPGVDLDGRAARQSTSACDRARRRRGARSAHAVRRAAGRAPAMTPGDDRSRSAQPAAARLHRTPSVRWPTSAGSADAAEPLLAILGRTADPDQALAGLARGLAERVEATAAALLRRALADDEGTAMRLLSVLGASPALGDHLARHPEHWRELTDPTARLHPAGGVSPSAPACCARSAPTRDDRLPRGDAARRARRSTRCGWSTAGCCCGSRPATSPHHARRRRRRRPSSSDLAAGTLEAGARGRPGRGSATGRGPPGSR